MTFRQGEVWRVDLEPARRGEIGKSRPCVIVSQSSFNDSSPTILVMPLSTYQPTDISPVVHASERTGLKEDSSLLAVHIRAIARSRFLKKIGTVPEAKVEEAVAILNDVL